MLPFVTCLMPTFGKCPELQWLLEESLESFLRQDYQGPKELLIYNDCKGQIIKFDHPEVRVINTDQRPETLGEVFNIMLLEASGDIIAPWEDDDISLPWRLSYSISRLQEANADYFNPQAYWFLHKVPELQHANEKYSWGHSDGTVMTLAHEQNTGYAHSAGIYTKRAAFLVGGYPHDCKQDAGMDGLLKGAGQSVRTLRGPISAEESVYIYRWGVGTHLSGNSDTQRAFDERGRRPYPAGVYNLSPKWLHDYRRHCEKAVNFKVNH